MLTLSCTNANIRAPTLVNGAGLSGHLELVRLIPLLERTRGGPQIKIGLINGSATLDH
jgi:hypothetical protein